MKINKLLFVLIIVVAVSLGFFVGQSMTPANRALRKAQELARRGITEKKEAVEILTKQKDLLDYSFKYAQLEKERQIIALSLANILIKYEMWPDAIKYLEIAKEILPGDFAVNYNLGFVYYKLFQLEKEPLKKDKYYKLAESYINTALQIDPEDIDANYLKGVFLFENRLYTDALAYFSKVLEKNPNEVNTLFTLGRMYYDMGELEKARNVYLKLQTVLPKRSAQMDRVINNLEIINKELGKR